MHPVFLIPGLFPEIPDRSVPRLPHLELALARGQLVLSPNRSVLEEWPDAAGGRSLAERMAHEAGIAQEAPHWLCADPIHLQVEGDALLLLERYSFSLSTEEAQALVAVLNGHFEGHGLKFFPVTPTAWLVGLQAPPRIQTTHPLRRVGRNIDGFLPQGEAARHWRSVFNEVQMLFHEHPVNQSREARRERAISGVWFWDCPAVADREARVVDSLRAPSAYGDEIAWQEAAQQLDRELFGPLLRRLKSGELEAVTLVALEGRCAARLTLARWQLWRFWRRARPLTRLSGIPALEHA
ncbi:MAG: hypothetical protein KGM83_03840 [Betaproteobacteria bacterium]|nr:hypothetical protein [Betaproteobacteria bacterium]